MAPNIQEHTETVARRCHLITLKLSKRKPQENHDKQNQKQKHTLETEHESMLAATSPLRNAQVGNRRGKRKTTSPIEFIDVSELKKGKAQTKKSQWLSTETVPFPIPKRSISLGGALPPTDASPAYFKEYASSLFEYPACAIDVSPIIETKEIKEIKETFEQLDPESTFQSWEQDDQVLEEFLEPFEENPNHTEENTISYEIDDGYFTYQKELRALYKKSEVKKITHYLEPALKTYQEKLISLSFLHYEFLSEDQRLELFYKRCETSSPR